jgi:hypothetical protein
VSAPDTSTSVARGCLEIFMTIIFAIPNYNMRPSRGRLLASLSAE